MKDFDRQKLRQFWKQTEIIREYQRNLFTYSDMNLPYVFVAEHNRFNDRALVRKGVVFIQKPHILLPNQYSGPEFAEGFEQAEGLADEAAYLFRAMGLPYSRVTNKPVADERIEYGSCSDVLRKFETKMEQENNSDTGLIKGAVEGVDVSLMRYSLGLVIKSAPSNIREFFEHIRRRLGEPIRPDEKITDEDIRKLFG